MQLYLLGVAPNAPPKQRETTTQPGPFIVASRDEAAARMLINMNFSTAVVIQPGERIPTVIWSDHSASYCVPIDGDEQTLRRRELVGSNDIAEDYLHQASLVDGGKVLARMVWWPCSPNDQCPVVAPSLA